MFNNLLIVYLITFLAALIFLRTLGFINVSDSELIGYGLMIYGLSIFYTSFIQRKKLMLFIGSGIFLSGVVFFLIGNFDLWNIEQLLIPASLFIFSIGLFMVYLSDTSQKIMFYLTLILFTAGIGAMVLVSTTGIDDYFENTLLITRIYWPVMIILFFVVVLVNRNAKEKSK
ncbi:MAG: hypothetical protein JSW63_10545 [Ignavibacterium sp.]|nr:MAG: hypothetical protein JSW63_10545 [Ignavibacterium sp.]